MSVITEQYSRTGSTISNGFRTGNSSVSSSDPNAALATISREQQERYEKLYVPVENEAISSLDDMSIMGDARERVDESAGGITRTMGRSRRELGRYGVKMTASQRQAGLHSLRADRATSEADTMNNARLNQFDRNRGLRNELINIGRGVQDQANQGIGDAASMQTQRENTNKMAKASAKAANTQMVGSLAGMALMAALVL